MMLPEGQLTTITESFVDDFDEPLELITSVSGPIIRLYHKKNVVVETYGYPDANGEPGDWAADIMVPKMDLTSPTEMSVVWVFKSTDGNVKVKKTVIVEPMRQARQSDIVYVVDGDSHDIEIELPVVFTAPVAAVPENPFLRKPATQGKPGDVIKMNFYVNNTPLFERPISTADLDPLFEVETGANHTTLRMPFFADKVYTIEPTLIKVEYKKPSLPAKTFTYKMWVITPQVLVACSMLSDYINKARLENVIPELEYTEGDLVQYLVRGLSLFNMYLPRITNFNGTNMQGTLLDAWLLCAAYYALSAQLQAEGSMAFDFSGQTVSLNVDRTPAIESALGRIETMLDNVVKPLKSQLATAGILGGDGSVGGKPIDTSSNLGYLTLTRAPTTRMIRYGAQAGFRFHFSR